MRASQAAILTMVGGALLVVGALLPWATVTSGFGTISIAGTDGDGIFAIALGIGILLTAFGGLGGSRAALQLAGLLGLAGAGLVLFEVVNLSGRLARPELDLVHASVGIGLWMGLVGSIIAFIAPAMGGKRAATPVPAATGSPDALAGLERLAALRASGAITPGEYEAKKAELLKRV